MNGICQITVKGKVYPLRYGMVAVEYLNKNIVSDNSALLGVHMIYAGVLNHAVANSLPVPVFGTVYDICEDFDEEPDNKEQGAAIQQCFAESKYGAKWMENLKAATAAIKKKAEELQKQIGTELEPIASES